MQLGFVAGGFGLIGRDLLFYLTVQNWEPLVLSELFFASFIFLGFILHTIGFAKSGVILSCLAGVGSATAFIFMLGWNSFFHLWYINLAILIIAVPLDMRLKVFLALIFISIYSSMFLLFSDLEPFYKIENSLENIEKLKPVSFHWKHNDEYEIGFIANELEELFPGLIKEREYKMIKENKLIPYLVDSIKTLKNRITKIKNERNKQL